MQKIPCHDFESTPAKFVSLILGTQNWLREKLIWKELKLLFDLILSPWSNNHIENKLL